MQLQYYALTRKQVLDDHALACKLWLELANDPSLSPSHYGARRGLRRSNGRSRFFRDFLPPHHSARVARAAMPQYGDPGQSIPGRRVL